KGTLTQPDLALIAPQLAGHVTEHLDLAGPPDNLALHGTVDGLATARGVQSGPFHLAIDATNLPGAPQGQLTGTGALYDSPLSLSATFARSAAGAIDLDLKSLSWKSLRGQGRITRAPGAMLPDGAMHIAMTRLADLAPLLHLKLAGALAADFTHHSGQPAAIALTASHLAYGTIAALRAARIDATIDHLATTQAIDATATLTGLDSKAAAGNLTLTAKGSAAALAVTAAGRFARLAGKPARLDLAATLDGKTRTIHLAKLDAAARGVTARLLGPATISAGATTEFRHLALALGGLGGAARITADGTIRPSLALDAKIANLPAGIARAADPHLAATGLLDATAHLTGTLAAPTGTIALQGRGLGLASGPAAKLPRATLAARETLLGHALRGDIAATLGPARLSLDGTVPLALTGPMDLSFRLDNLSASLLHAADPKLTASGMVTARARLTGTPRAPRGTVDLAATSMRLLTGPAASLPPADLTAHETLLGHSARGTARLSLGNRADLTLAGTAPLSAGGAIDLALTGIANLHLLDPLTAAGGTAVGGTVTPDLRVTGTLAAPRAAGTLTLAGGRVQNIASGLDLSAIDATITAAGRTIRLDRLSAKAGAGTIDGSGSFGLAKPMPVDLRLAFHHASPIASDILTERLGGALSLTGDIDTGARLAGTVAIETANIQIPQGLPPSVVRLDIRRKGARPPPPAAPAPPVALDLTVDARNEVFVRGKGLFANLGG
ncbi:MAG: translocation/assembly module TamB, partial [Acidiphilium sp. 21-66-27]